MNQNQTSVTAMFITGVLLPIVAATIFVMPIIAVLGKGTLWGVKKEE